MSHCTLQSVQDNGSLWADVFLVKDGASPDPSKPNFDSRAVHHTRKCEPLCYKFWQTALQTSVSADPIPSKG